MTALDPKPASPAEQTGSAIEQPKAQLSAGYYGMAIVAPHVWKDLIGAYFFTGGLAGASSLLAAVAQLTGRTTLAGHARRAALVGLVPSPVLLIADLGRPARFMNMLRVCKPTSPMSVGTWVLSIYGPAASGAALLGTLGFAPRLGRMLTLFAGGLGPVMATYTAVLVGDTATPVWHEARAELPFVFAASAAASAGAVTSALAVLSGRCEPAAQRMAVAGAVAEVAAATRMRARLGPLDTYRTDRGARRYDRLARLLSLTGAAGLAFGGRRRPLLLASSAAISAGSYCERIAVLRAGTASASDPQAVIRSQTP